MEWWGYHARQRCAEIEADVISAHKELDAFLDRKATAFYIAILNLVEARYTGDIQKARKDLAETIQRTMILADLNGRKRLLMEFDHAKEMAAKFAEVPHSSPIAPGIVFEEAVEDLFKRDPRLERSSAEISRLYSTQKVFAMARSAEMTVTRRAQDEITKWLGSGSPAQALEKTLEEIGPFSRAYAETVFRTNAATAYSEGRIQQAKDEDVAEVIVGFRYEGVDDAFTRENHRAGFGSIAPTDHPTWKMHKPPQGYNCYAPWTKVSGSFVGGLKTYYSGEIVQIETANGNRLSVTLNHPVFANGGWVPAGKLRKGDYLLSNRSDVKFVNKSNPGVALPLSTWNGVDNQDAPSSIEDVFDALRVKGVSSSWTGLPMLPLDLHGDAALCDGYIDVVTSDWMLPSALDPSRKQGIKDLGLKLSTLSPELASHPSGHFDPYAERFRLASSGNVSRPDLVRSLLSAHPGPLEPLRLGLGAELNVVADEKTRYSSSVDMKFFTKLKEASASKIAPDQITFIRKLDYSGHVYDLQTETGWILSENIVTSNCRCALEYVSVYEAERLGLWKDGKLTPMLASNTVWYPDPGFRVEG